MKITVEFDPRDPQDPAAILHGLAQAVSDVPATVQPTEPQDSESEKETDAEHEQRESVFKSDLVDVLDADNRAWDAEQERIRLGQAADSYKIECRSDPPRPGANLPGEAFVALKSLTRNMVGKGFWIGFGVVVKTGVDAIIDTFAGK
ncbi:MAG: hypothetical protein AAF663_08975 [Planctomycetota bacterium]